MKMQAEILKTIYVTLMEVEIGQNKVFTHAQAMEVAKEIYKRIYYFIGI